jgi:hypothetical protein
VQAEVRRRLLRVFARRGLLPNDDVRAVGQWAHGGGISADGTVRIEAEDRAGRERLLRHCAQPPFARDRLRELGLNRLVGAAVKPSPPPLLRRARANDRLRATYSATLCV